MPATFDSLEWPCISIHDLKNRLASRVQLPTDGYKAYLSAVESAFGSSKRSSRSNEALAEKSEIRNWSESRYFDCSEGAEEISQGRKSLET